jgi:FMN reductase
MTRRIAVVSAGLSDPSSTRLLADLLGKAAVDALEQRLRDDEQRLPDVEPVETHVVELRPLAHPLADRLLTGFATGELAEAVEAVTQADAVIAVTPVFSASYSGLFKTFFDVLERGALDGTPVLVAATAGTARHSLVLEHALRPLFSHLHAVVVPTGVFAASEDWGSGGADAALVRRIQRAAGELAGLVAAREPTTRIDAFDRDLAAMGDFEELLNR